MAKAPSLIAFDSLQTLFSLEPLREELEGLGLPRDALELWFARTLRDGFALAASSAFAPFEEVATAALQGLLVQLGGPAEQAGAVVERLRELPAEPDVRLALQAVRASGIPAAIVTNGSKATTAALLRSSDLAGLVEVIVSADDVGLWKPRRELYQQVANVMSMEPADITLVSAHAWDVHGAREAWLGGAWVRREERVYPGGYNPPDLSADSLVDLVEGLLAR